MYYTTKNKTNISRTVGMHQPLYLCGYELKYNGQSIFLVEVIGSGEKGMEFTVAGRV